MNKIDIFIQNEIKKPKNKLLKDCYESGKFTNYELLYFFPNNYLRHHGFQPLRGGKRKRYNKHRIMSFRLFEIIENIVEEMLYKEWSESPFIEKFVEFKNLDVGQSYMGCDLSQSNDFYSYINNNNKYIGVFNNG